MATGRRPGFLRPGTVTPPTTGGGSLSADDANRLLYNTLILQTPTISDLPSEQLPDAYTSGSMYTLNSVDYFRLFDDNNNGAEVMTTDITDVDVLQRIANIQRT